MSFKAMAFATEQDITQTSPQSHLLLILASYTNDNNECYPSINTLMKKTRLSEKTVRKSLKDLIVFGLISDTGENSKYCTKIYKINYIDNKETTTSKNATPSKNATGNFSDTPSKFTTEPLVDLPPNPIINLLNKKEEAENQELLLPNSDGFIFQETKSQPVATPVTEEMITQAITYLVDNQKLLNAFNPVNRDEIRFEINQSMQFKAEKNSDKPVLAILASYLHKIPVADRMARFQTLPQAEIIHPSHIVATESVTQEKVLTREEKLARIAMIERGEMA